MNGRPSVAVMGDGNGGWVWELRSKNGATVAASWNSFATVNLALAAWKRAAALVPFVDLADTQKQVDAIRSARLEASE